MSEIDVKKIEIGGTIKDGISIGMKNIGPIFVNVLLWTLTAWIPYINIGTTIGLSVGIIAKASRGEEISIVEIFEPKYRKYMGEFFLTSGLISIGMLVGAVLMIIPAYVIGMAWFFATLLVIDKEKNPMEAISLSNKITYGNKGRMFWTIFIPAIIYGFVIGILSAISGIGSFGSMGSSFNAASITSALVSSLIICVLSFILMVVMIGIEASLYKQLAKDV